MARAPKPTKNPYSRRIGVIKRRLSKLKSQMTADQKTIRSYMHDTEMVRRKYADDPRRAYNAAAGLTRAYKGAQKRNESALRETKSLEVELERLQRW